MSEWRHSGDMAKSVARQLQNEHLAKIEAGGAALVDESSSVMQGGKSLFDKIVFRWRPDEQSQLERIRAAADMVMADLSTEARKAIDDLYLEFRVPEQHPQTGVVVRDHKGCIVWKKDDRGQDIERWEQMTGQDIETCLFVLARLRFDITQKTNELLLEAVFAKHIHDDQYHDAYSELLEETIPGRQAYASRKTRQDKYHAYFTYYLWSCAKVFQDEIMNFCRTLERVMYWRVEGEKSGKTTPAL